MKKTRGLKILIIFLVFAVLVSGTVLAFLFVSKSKAPEKEPEPTPEPVAEEQPVEKEPKIATLSFVGDVSLADNWYIAPKYDSRGGISGVLGDSMLNLMKDSTFMVANSEFTVSNRGTKMKNKTYTFRAKPERLKIYDEMGVDLVSLANNHVYDFGKDAFLDMLDAFEKYKIPHVGAGRNLEEAKEAYITEINGKTFAFFGTTRAEKNILTPGATKNSEGVFRCYDPTEAVELIKKLDKKVDFVVPLVHFGRENSHDLEKVQIDTAKKFIDAGADIIIGHHAHVLQGFEFYKDKLIVYNLGNFLFNDLETDTMLFQISMDETGKMEYSVFPALQKDEKTSLVSGAKKSQIIKDLNSWSVNVKIDSDGKIEKK